MIGERQAGAIQAYWVVSEYLRRVDDRLRVEECRNVKSDRARQVLENADRWLMKKIHEANVLPEVKR